MNIKKFTIEVRQIKIMEVEVNTDIVNEDYLENFSSYMFDVNSVEDIAKHVAWSGATQEGCFIEGIGEWTKDYDKEKNLLDQGVHVDIISEEDTEIEVL